MITPRRFSHGVQPKRSGHKCTILLFGGRTRADMQVPVGNALPCTAGT